MLFYTTAVTSTLPAARTLATNIKQYIPDAIVCLLLCDKLPAPIRMEDEPFDKVLDSADFHFSGEIGNAYWHFLHTPNALQAAVKPMGAIHLTRLTSEDKVIYLAPTTAIPPNLGELDRLLDAHDIIIAPHPMLSIADFDPRQSAYDPGFFAAKSSSIQGTLFLHRWAHAAEMLWQTLSDVDEFAYNRLLDATPALFDSACILQDAYFSAADQTTQTSDADDALFGFPCAYSTYDNGEPIREADRKAARSGLLFERFAMTDPFSTREEECLYRCLRNREEQSEVGLYWNEYQEVVNSTSYRVGKKLVDLAGKLLPTNLFNKLRGKSPDASASALPEFSLTPTDEKLDIVPLIIPDVSSPSFSIIITDCTDFEQSYRTIRSVINSDSKETYEIILPNRAAEQISETIVGITVAEGDTLSDLLSLCRGKYALLLEQSMDLPADFLSSAAARMEENSCGIAQAKVCFSDGKILEAGGILTRNAQRISYGFGLDKELGCVRYAKEIDCTAACGILIDLDAYRACGELDSAFSPLYALADLSFRLRFANRKTMYLPDLQLTDRRCADTSLQPFASASEAYPFLMKWKDTLTAEHINDSSEIFLGRDRSRNRLTVFAVDNRIPCYDLTAGDRNTYHYYELMAKMGYNLKIVGDDYQRQEPYATKLEKLGIEVVAADGNGEVEYRTFLRDNGRFINAVYLNRPNNLLKYMPDVSKYCNARIVYCCHDLHFLRELREHEVNGNKKEAERVKAYAKEEISRMDVADVIFDVSAYEKSILDRHLKHARVEVNPIFIYHEFPEFTENFADRKDLLFVGSFKHPGNLDGVDWLCKEIMPLITKALPDVKLHLVGAHPTPAIKALANENVIVHGFLSDEDLAEMYRTCRLSVVPLRFGAGVKGKVLEAMYHGLPIVSTSIGTEGIVDIEQCIENTDTAKEFADKVIALYPEIDTLTEMGRTNWQYVQDHLGTEPAMALFKRSFE